MHGTVKWFNTEKHFGFVTGEDGKDYFLHRSFLPEGYEPQENDKVEFEPAETERGIQAQQVKKES